MIWSTKIGDEVYIYYKGELIYKRWLDHGYGRVIPSQGLNND